MTLPSYSPALSVNAQPERLPGETDADYYIRQQRPAPLVGETDVNYKIRVAGLAQPSVPTASGGYGYVSSDVNLKLQ